jgi:hypothetical protein
MFAFVMVVGSALLASPQPPVPAEPDSPAATPAPQSTPTPAPRPASKTPATPTKVAPPVPFPHPLITEVLYAVPTGDEGDADGDGVRSATGDEFVELINPHSRPIRLKGYVLTDGRNLLPSGGTSRNSRREPPSGTKPAKGTEGGSGGSGGGGGATDRKSRIRFEFPDITLQPGQVVVVFNGFKGKDAKRVTDPDAAPKKLAKAVAGVPAPIILSMGITSQFAAFANTGDCVLLLDPKGNGFHCIAWGEKTKPPEDAAPLLERAPEGRGSIARVGLARGLGEHSELDDAGLLFSPGVHVMTPEAEPEEAIQPLPSAPATPAPSPAPEAKPTSVPESQPPG